MNKKQLEFAERWLGKARNDLFTADALIERQDSPVDVIAFHSQQAIEKALKGLLTAKSIKFQRTHDLDELADLAAPILPDLQAWRGKFAILSHFAVDVRYPDTTEEPSWDDASQARDDAWAIFRLVEVLIRTWLEEAVPGESNEY